MDTTNLLTKFARIGATAEGRRPPVPPLPAPPGVISLDVQADRKGEFFEIVRRPGAEAEVAVLDVQPADRHLLLLVREGEEKSKFLCGHDERHWFVAGIPETAPVGTVRQAKEALKPAEVQVAQARKGLRAEARNRRKNAAYRPPGRVVLPARSPASPWTRSWSCRNEPLRRGNGGKPHWAEFCYRTGGETVYVCSRHPNGVTEAQYKAHPGRQPEGEGLGLADDAAEPGRLRPGPRPARRPRHDHPARLAPGRDEHRGPVEGDAERGLPRLTHPRVQQEIGPWQRGLPRADSVGLPASTGRSYTGCECRKAAFSEISPALLHLGWIAGLLHPPRPKAKKNGRWLK